MNKMSEPIMYPKLEPSLNAFMLKLQKRYGSPRNNVFKIQTEQDIDTETPDALYQKLSKENCSSLEYQELIWKSGHNHFWITPRAEQSKHMSFVVEMCRECGKHHVLAINQFPLLTILATDDDAIISVLDGLVESYLSKAN